MLVVRARCGGGAMRSPVPAPARRRRGQGEDGAIEVYYLATRTRETLYYYSNNYNYYRCRQTQMIDFYFG